MDLTFQEYIKQYYNVTEKIRARVVNPVDAIRQADSMPYDDIIFYEGELQKVVYLDADTPIPVAELIGYTKEEIDKINDAALTNVYVNYMENIETSDMDVQSLIQAAQMFMKDKRDQRRRQLACIQ